jgi:predicted CxxxxCH...CXXCH cytochrome family protein
MKKMSHQKQLLQFVMLALLSVFSVLVTANESFAANCATCHGQGTTDIRPLDTAPGSLNSYRNITSGAVKGSHSKHLAATAVATNCTPCHNTTMSSTSHRDGRIEMAGSLAYDKGAGTVTFTNQTSVPVLGTCSVACHNATSTTVGITTPTWGATATCTSCHAEVPGSSHTKHVSGTQSKNALCIDCHASTVRNVSTLPGHVDGIINVTGYTQQNKPKGSAPSTCLTTYCHSSGQSFNGASATPIYAASEPLWGNPSSGSCSTCHEVNLMNTGSHGTHVAYNDNCGNCHSGAGAATMVSPTHVDGLIDVNGSYAVNYSQGLSSARGNNYGTCSAASCHSATLTAVATPTWGTQGTCSSCHAASPVSGAHTLHIAMPAVTCASCHTGATGTNGGASHFNDLVDVAQYSAGVAKHAAGVYTATCSTACHSTDTTAVATPTWGAQATCSSCHATSPATGAHTKHINAPVAAACATCHTGATVGTSGGPGHGNNVIDVVQYTGGNTPKHAPGVFTATCSTACHSTDTTAVATPVWGATATCASCHAASPVSGSHAKHTAIVTVTCDSCHTGAVAGSNGGTGHGDGNINVAAGYPPNVAKHAAGTYTGTCSTACHSTTLTAVATPIWGATATCASCHAASPVTGSHSKHIASGAGCASCHTAPGAAGHINSNIDVSQSYPATPKHVAGTFVGTCSTVCHSPFTNAPSTTPIWGATATCASCHAASPVTGSHSKHIAGGAGCASCHTAPGAVGHINSNIEVSQSYPATAKHVSGTYAGTCSTTCHSSTLTAVATPTWGTTATCASCHDASPTTGTHTKHTARVACTSCHTSPGAAGHVNSNVSVAVGGYPTTVAKHAAGSGYSTCSNISCHNSTTGTNSFTAPAIAWGSASINCASCHGYPPVNDSHLGQVAGSCNSCHSNVLPGGTITASTFVDPALHLNNNVEGGNCDSCHGYPPVRLMAGMGINSSYSSAKLQNYSGGGGVHNVAGHLPLTLKSSQGLAFEGCITCHPSSLHNQGGPAGFLTANVQVVVDTQFKFDKNRPIVYNAKQTGTGKTSGTCANVSCHFQKSPLWSSEAYTQGH